MDYRELAVGSPFYTSATDLAEGHRLMVVGGLVVFAMFRIDPDAGRIEAVRHGRCEFFLWSHEGRIVVCLHCHSPRCEVWADAPFDVRDYADAEGYPTPAPPRADEPAFGEAIVALVDASDGIVAALRAVALSDHFMRSLSDAVYRQSLAPLDEAADRHDMMTLYARYPTAERLARACVIRSEGWA